MEIQQKFGIFPSLGGLANEKSKSNLLKIAEKSEIPNFLVFRGPFKKIKIKLCTKTAEQFIEINQKFQISSSLGGLAKEK